MSRGTLLVAASSATSNYTRKPISADNLDREEEEQDDTGIEGTGNRDVVITSKCQDILVLLCV